MKAPGLPENEAERTAALDRLQIINTPQEARFERLTRLAKRHFKASSALISLVYENKQWFKSHQGLNACETSRELSFCGHVVELASPMVVNNALEDPRFQDNPLVTGEPKIRFYAGHPIYDKDGILLGTFCLLDQVPRPFNADELQDLSDFAALAELELTQNRFSEGTSRLIDETTAAQRGLMIDPLLGCWNARGIEQVIQRELKSGATLNYNLGLLRIKLNDYEQIARRYGDARALEIVKLAIERIQNILPADATLGASRIDQFLVVCPNIEADALKQLEGSIRRKFLTDALTLNDIRALVDVSTEIQPLVTKGLDERAIQQVIHLIAQVQ